MIEPMFFKNMGKHTVVLDDNLFVQIHRRKSVRTASVGKNLFICEETVKNDVQISEEEFLCEFDEHMSEMSVYVELIKSKTP